LLFSLAFDCYLDGAKEAIHHYVTIAVTILVLLVADMR
jgi:hypothetical protein